MNIEKPLSNMSIIKIHTGTDREMVFAEDKKNLPDTAKHFSEAFNFFKQGEKELASKEVKKFDGRSENYLELIVETMSRSGGNSAKKIEEVLKQEKIDCSVIPGNGEKTFYFEKDDDILKAIDLLTSNKDIQLEKNTQAYLKEYASVLMLSHLPKSTP